MDPSREWIPSSHIPNLPRLVTSKGNVLNYVQKVLEIGKGHGKKVCVDQNTDLHPLGGNHDPWQEVKTVSPGLKSLVQEDRDLMKELVREALQSFLEAEMTEFLGASSGERTDERKGYRAGYYRRSWITRVGKVELAVPRDRSGQL